MARKTLVGILTLTLCVVFLMIPVTAEVVSDVVNIPDPNLRAAVHKTLNQPSTASITVEDMLYLTELEATEGDIFDLAGLHAPNLVKLNLSGNRISDVTPLANLTDLTLLGLNHNAIVDVSPLTTLTQLGYLGLGNNTIFDISPLTALTELVVLELRDNPLDAAAVDVHIPAIAANGTEVHHGPTDLTLVSCP